VDVGDGYRASDQEPRSTVDGPVRRPSLRRAGEGAWVHIDPCIVLGSAVIGLWVRAASHRS